MKTKVGVEVMKEMEQGLPCAGNSDENGDCEKCDCTGLVLFLR